MNSLTGSETLKEIRNIIKANDFLFNVKTAGKGRTKKVIVKEINDKIKAFNDQQNKDDQERDLIQQQRMQFDIFVPAAKLCFIIKSLFLFFLYIYQLKPAMNSIAWILATVCICNSMFTPPRRRPGDGFQGADFASMVSLTQKIIEPRLLPSGTWLTDMYFTDKFQANVMTAKSRIEADPSEAEGRDIIYIRHRVKNPSGDYSAAQWYELKIPQNIIIFSGAFCPPHKEHFERIETVYPHYDHIIIAIQENSEERNGYTFETIAKIWSIYLELLPDKGQKITFYAALTTSTAEPFMSAYNYALKEFPAGRRMVDYQIPYSRVDILMGFDNIKYIKQKGWMDWIEKRKQAMLDKMDRQQIVLWREWFEEHLSSDFVVVTTKDTQFHASLFVEYIKVGNKAEMLKFLPTALTEDMQRKVFQILFSERGHSPLPWAKGSGPNARRL